jgi:hypothetical protein
VGVNRAYWSGSIGQNIPWTNGSGYRNETVDDLISRTQGEPDPKERIALFKELQRIVLTDLPTLPLVELKFFTVQAANLQTSAPRGDRSTAPSPITGSTPKPPTENRAAALPEPEGRPPLMPSTYQPGSPPMAVLNRRHALAATLVAALAASAGLPAEAEETPRHGGSAQHHPPAGAGDADPGEQTRPSRPRSWPATSSTGSSITTSISSRSRSWPSAGRCRRTG